MNGMNDHWPLRDLSLSRCQLKMGMTTALLCLIFPKISWLGCESCWYLMSIFLWPFIWSKATISFKLHNEANSSVLDHFIHTWFCLIHQCFSSLVNFLDEKKDTLSNSFIQPPNQEFTAWGKVSNIKALSVAYSSSFEVNFPVLTKHPIIPQLMAPKTSSLTSSPIIQRSENREIGMNICDISIFSTTRLVTLIEYRISCWV